MSLPTALGALKTAADLGTHLRNLLKQNEQLPVNEILARLIEMQDLITDGRSSIIDFQEELMTKNDEIRQIKSEIDALNDRKRIDSEMEHDGYVFWRIIDGKRTGPFCPPCWRRDNTLLPLKHVPGTYGGSHPSRRYDCPFHQVFLVPTGAAGESEYRRRYGHWQRVD